ncbi:MAG: helix-turn-helix transcriptional regulator [Lactobacillus sp.]|jgi:DNA-binding Xre family transcriptional regulator|nr:helix-turn-helix transcriptional regulator [Lactobacillus sp.]
MIIQNGDTLIQIMAARFSRDAPLSVSNVTDTVQKLAKLRGTSVTTLERAGHLGSGVVKQFEHKSGLRIATLITLAKLLDVKVSDLLTPLRMVYLDTAKIDPAATAYHGYAPDALPDAAHIYTNIAAALTARRWPANKLARIAGISGSTLSNLKNTTQINVSVETLMKISAALNMALEQLLQKPPTN